MTEARPQVYPHKKISSFWIGMIILALIVIVGLLIYRGYALSQKKNAAQRVGRGEVPVQLSPAARKNLTYSFYSTGDIAPLMEIGLYPKVSGYLERIDVRMGDSVRQGQVVAQIEQSDFLQKVKEVEAKVAFARAQLAEIEAGTRSEELRQAEESVRQAQSRFDHAKLQKERMEALYSRQIVSKRDFDNADMDYKVTEAQLEANQQHLKQLREGARQEVKLASQAKLKEMEALLAQEQIRLRNTVIAAPFQGEIMRKYVDSGALVSPSTPLVHLVHTATLKVVANVLERDIPLLKPGIIVRIRTEAYPDKVFEGKVARVNTGLDSSTRTLQAEIEIPNSTRELRPGMFARIEVFLQEKTGVVVVPREAVVEEQGEKFVFMVDGNKATRRPVVTGIAQDQFVEIREGLKEGEQVVTKGQNLIRENSMVRVVTGS
jgi:multidrug efflux pump subunit AcrA (membrane-fusion protein)